MKSTVSKATQDYLKRLEEAEKKGEDLGPYQAYPDVVDQFIRDHKLRIQKLFFDVEMDLMLVVLNNRKILKYRLSKYPALHKAIPAQLQAYEISPMGVHWPELDADLSLNGFWNRHYFLLLVRKVK